jgi:hypothetical protein
LLQLIDKERLETQFFINRLITPQDVLCQRFYSVLIKDLQDQTVGTNYTFILCYQLRVAFQNVLCIVHIHNAIIMCSFHERIS